MKTSFSIFSVFIFLIVFQNISSAQNYTTQAEYKWELKRTLFSLSPEQKKEDALLVKEFKVFDYQQNPGESLLLHYTHHKIVRVNNDKAIEEFNKVYIPVYGIKGPVDLSVRTIKPNGEIVVLNGDKIKELKNVEDAGDFKIFAFEGVEPGCEVEYIVKYIKPASSVGREFIQSGHTSINTSIYIKIPKIFQFEYAFYNCDFNLKVQSEDDSYNSHYYTGELQVKKLKEEQMAYYRSALARMDYSISVAQNLNSRLNWTDIGDKVIVRMLPPSTLSKKVSKIIKTLEIDKKPNDSEKIQAIESYIKNNISITSAADEKENISSILKNKFASESGILTLYMEFFRQANVDYSMVFTTDRTRINFDKEKASWLFLEENLFYFPKTEKFLAPSAIYNRYPMIPSSWTDNYGLFIRVFHTGSETDFKSSVQYIAPLSYEYNHSDLDVKVKLDLEKEVALLDLSEKFYGEPGIYYQPFYGLVDEEKKKEIVNSVLKKPSEEGTPSDGMVVDYNREISPALKPFIVKGKLSSAQLLQNAGKKYIFNLGDLIGPQSEWYVDTLKRNLPIQPRYGHFYIRNIEVNIPEGYQAKNLESINMDVSMAFKDDPKSCYFKSWYKTEGSKILVTIEEYYKLSEYPAEKYEAFRKVINAAADFNKVTILLEEK